MKSDGMHSRVRQYLEQLAAAGRYSFESREAEAALVISAKAMIHALNRLAKQGLFASPAKSFYVKAWRVANASGRPVS
jgi:hypothetical protein